MKPLYKKILISCAVITAVVLSVCSIVYWRQQAKIKADAAELQRKLKEVESHQGLSYGNKTMGDLDLSGLTVQELSGRLEDELSGYQERTVTLLINDDSYTYSMKDFKEKFSYRCSDGNVYAAGEEKELAEHIVSIDKDLKNLDQYAIIAGEKEAEECTVTVEVAINNKRISKVVENLSGKYEIPVKNSHILKSGKITKTAKGRTLKTATLKKNLKKYLKQVSKENYEATYDTTVVNPTWFPSDLAKVNTVISEFTTTFVYTTSRGYNIQLGASRLDGTCLLPGEKVSFDEVLHDGSDGKDFQEAGSYLNGETVQTKGGGICQLSTTAYNAVLRAGILPSRRYAHSMPVHYVPLGLDATVSEGVKDLEITNTLDVPLVISVKTNQSNLTVKIISYNNALGEYSYVPRAIQLSSTKAKAYLDTYKRKKKVKSLLLHTDTYILP